MRISDFTAKVIGDKRRWRAYQARTRQLPERYRATVDALERYLFIFGPEKEDNIQTMLDDLADLFEQAAADRTPIRAVVGDDPVEFAEAFLRNYTEGGWITRERDRLTTTIDRVAGNEP